VITLANGIPLLVQNEPYSFEGPPPLRRGDEATIRTAYGLVHVILLKGQGRKRWLVACAPLRRYLREDARLKLEEVMK
jgi:hypothetical protein